MGSNAIITYLKLLNGINRGASEISLLTIIGILSFSPMLIAVPFAMCGVFFGDYRPLGWFIVYVLIISILVFGIKAIYLWAQGAIKKGGLK